MLKGLYHYYLSPNSQMDKVFKLNANESARGVRLILNDFRDIDKLKFLNVIRVGEDLFKNDEIYFDKEDAYVDILFPPLGEGIYQSEIAIIQDNKKLLSGIFELEYVKSLTGSEEANLKKLVDTNLIDTLLKSKDTIQELLDKTKTLESVMDKSFEFEQMQASKEWVVNHNLNKFPAVSVVDTGKNEVIGSIKHLDKNNLIINFSHAFSGMAFLN